MYAEENSKKEYLGTGYIIKERINGINSAVNYAINPPEIFAKFNYKIIENKDNYYKIKGKNGEFQINEVKEKYIKQNEPFI